MTKYLDKSFSVHAPNSEQYRVNWDAIFGKKDVVIGVDQAAGEDEHVLVDCTTYEEMTSAGAELTPETINVSWDDEGFVYMNPGGGLIAQAVSVDLARTMCESLNIFFDDCRKPTSDIRKQVEEFHHAMGQPVVDTPTVPELARVGLRLRLVAEEFVELLAACGIFTDTQCILTSMIDRGIEKEIVMKGRVDLVEVADALADLDYVIEGMRLELGINGKPIANEVHRSNMSKLGDDGKPVLNESGKVTKGPNYSKPDIDGELRKQGWQG